MSSVEEEMEKHIGPEFIVFEDRVTRRLTFTERPEKGQFAAESGKIVESFYFPVTEDSEEKVLPVSSNRLLRILYPLLKAKQLIGRTFDITALGVGMARKWDVKEVEA